jgi:hypothetical protein
MFNTELKKVKKDIRAIREGKDVLYEKGFVRRRAKEDYQLLGGIKRGDREDAEKYQAEFLASNKLSRSLIDDKDMLKKKAREIRYQKLSAVDKLLKTIKKISYFNHLFPLVKEEKPGRDLYALTTFWQFVICFYVINFYPKLDSRGT